MRLVATLLANQSRHAALRRDLHAHPELAFQESRTSGIVARALEAAGIEVHRGLATTGVVGVLKNGTNSRAIGLRADMDALPIPSRTASPTAPATKAVCMPAATTATRPCCWQRRNIWPPAVSSTAPSISSSSRQRKRWVGHG